MQESPSWQTNRFSSSQAIPRILWNPEVHYDVYYRPLPVPILNQINPVYNPFHFLIVHLNIIVPSTPGFPSGLRASGFPTKWLYTPLLFPVRATWSTHFIILDFINRIFGEEYRSLSSSLCSFLHSPVTSSLLGPNILLSTRFLNTLNLPSSLNVSDQGSHPYKTRSKIIVLYIYFYIFG